MDKLTFNIVDVFAEEKYAGNQLAVFRGGGSLSAQQMQRIALEMHYSETTFIVNETPVNGGFDVRIFTPGAEVPFAGHPTLGTAHIIRQQVLQQPVDRVILNLKVGQIPVTFDDRPESPCWMQQIPPNFGAQVDGAALAGVLNLSAEDMDGRFPVEEVSTGLPFIITPIKSLAALQKIKVNTDGLLQVLQGTQAREVLVFCPETHLPGNHLACRMFAHVLGVPEDPATGSANGCLAAYLVKHRYFGGSSIDIRVEQGFEIMRPSLLYLRADDRAGQITVRVGGKAITVAQGEFL